MVCLPHLFLVLVLHHLCLRPVYADVPSLNSSPDNAYTGGSFVGIESPEETLSRIAHGRVRGHENAATTSGGGNYSPPIDEFPFF
ncbi:unnamed protein product [Miscanthus lutarioriparius]|uniref:Secreted protein n=1 Tax=Miscanthus lutarioriparius TaxID=422564 RepID=A0A811QEI3_9POAL|nr:unnamed protein product [Miscanthus lutarioriparius]